MNEAASRFWAEAARLDGASGKLRLDADGRTELFIPTALGTLELEGDGDFVSVACGRLFIEDHPVTSGAACDFLLAICDAVLAGQAEVARPRVRHASDAGLLRSVDILT